MGKVILILFGVLMVFASLGSISKGELGEGIFGLLLGSGLCALGVYLWRVKSGQKQAVAILAGAARQEVNANMRAGYIKGVLAQTETMVRQQMEESVAKGELTPEKAEEVISTTLELVEKSARSSFDKAVGNVLKPVISGALQQGIAEALANPQHKG